MIDGSVNIEPTSASPIKEPEDSGYEIAALSIRARTRGGGYSLIWAIWVFAAPKGTVFQPFWS